MFTVYTPAVKRNSEICRGYYYKVFAKYLFKNHLFTYLLQKNTAKPKTTISTTKNTPTPKPMYIPADGRVKQIYKKSQMGF